MSADCYPKPMTIRSLELRVPPVALVLISAALMWLGAWSGPRLGSPFPGRRLIAGGLALLLGGLGGWFLAMDTGRSQVADFANRASV